MSKNTKLCPFRKISEQGLDIAGQTTMRERFQPCIGKKCMAYVYTAPYLTIGGKDATKNPDCWGCARLLQGGIDDETRR